MKQAISDFFSVISQPENFKLAIAFILSYTLFTMLLGVGLAWIISTLVGKKVNRPVSFDDLIQQTNYKTRRVK